MEKILYCKYANDRNEAFKIKTVIIEKNGVKEVVKSSLSPKGDRHIKQIYENYKLLKCLNTSNNIDINKAIFYEDSIRFEYIEGSTLTTLLNNYIEENNSEAIRETLNHYVEIIKLGQVANPFKYTDGFKAIFGEIDGLEGLEAVEIANVDLSFDNIIINDKVNICDYEWVYNFPIPIKFIQYRALKYYIEQLQRNSIVVNDDIWSMIGITEKEKHTFEQMECYFYNYINSEYINLHDLNTTWSFNKEKYTLDEMLQARLENEKTNGYQIFYNYAEGFNEQDSDKKIYVTDNNGAQVIKIPINKKLKGLRLDPSYRNCMLTIEYMHVYEGGGTYKATYESNANYDAHNIMIFITNDPMIIFTNINYETASYIELKYNISYLSEGELYALAEHMKYAKKMEESICLYKTEKQEWNEKIRQLIQDNHSLLEMHKVISEQYQQLNSLYKDDKNNFDKYKSILEKNENQIKDLNQQIKDLDQQIKDLNQQNIDLSRQIRAKDERIDAICSTKAWRIAEKARKLKNKMIKRDCNEEETS